MPFFKSFLVAAGCFLSFSGWAQRINNTAGYHNFSGDKYFRLHMDNDMFFQTDYYYTHGLNFELVHPSLSKNPLAFLLIRSKKKDVRYGVALEHFIFTPEKIEKPEITYGDRPYAATLLINSFSISTDMANQTRISSTLTLGTIGRFAMAKKMQGVIHDWTGSDEPLGWSHQIKSDFLINYEVNHEKELLVFPNLFHLMSHAQIRAGSYNSRLQAGLTFSLGRFASPFQETTSHNNFQLYLYYQPAVNGIVHDATLQGGIFNKKSPYTLSNSEIKRITWQNRLGIVAFYKKYFLELNGAFLSPEFDGGRSHKWGGISIGLNI